MSYSDIVSDGGMDPRNKLDETMYRLTVAQRDAAWREVEAWKRRYEEMVKVLSDHASLQRPPVMLADKESYEAGRVMERQAMLQLFTDPENQPTQHGTVTVEYMQREIAAEREACAEKTGEFARKWWSIHCASNKHMETTRKAHDDFCALQAAIRARGQE